MRPILVAPGAFAALRPSQVAAAIGRGLECAGLQADLCPATDGGPGTLETLLVALGGEAVGGGFALVEDEATAVIDALPDARATAVTLVAARDSGAAVLVLAARGAPTPGAQTVATIDEEGGLGDATLVVLDDPSAPGELARALRDHAGARVVPGAPFVLDALGFDARMRAGRCVITGAGTIGPRDLRGTLVAEVATRARQSGVPCFAIAGLSDLDLFSARVLDLQVVAPAATADEIETAAQALAPQLPSS